MSSISIVPLHERLISNGNKTTITLNEYLEILHSEGSFIIPDYQRGYVWGQKKKNGSSDISSDTTVM